MTDQKKPEPGKALDLVPKETRALMQTASDVGALVVRNGMPFLDLSQPQILANYNVLAPSMIVQQVSPNFTPYVSQLKFSVKDDGVYPIDKKWNAQARREEVVAVGLGKRQLMLLAKAMGATVRSDVVMDARGNMFGKAEFETRRIDGTPEIWPGNKAWIKDNEYAKVVESCPDTKWEGKGDNRSQVPMTEADKAAWIKSNFIRVTDNAYQMTDTKAIERAIRAAGAIPTKIPVADLDKPFLVLSTVYTPDPSNVAVQLALVEKGQTAADALYGSGQPALVHRPMMDADDEEPSARPANVDADGVLHEEIEEAEVEVVRDGVDTPPSQSQGVPKPDRDWTISKGTYAGEPLSDICRDDPAYARDSFVSAGGGLAELAKAWIAYWVDQVGGDDDNDFSGDDIPF